MRRFLLIVFLAASFSATAHAQMRHGVQAGYKFGGLPDGMLDSYFTDYKPVFAHAVNLDYILGYPNRHWSFGLFYSAMSVTDGYWRVNETLPEEGIFSQFPLHFLGVTAAHTWRFNIIHQFYVSPTVGIGLLGIIGDVYATELIPGCPGPTQSCGHWKEVTRKPVEMTRVMPLFLLSAALEYELDADTQVSIDLGFANLPYVGISFRRTLSH